MCIHTRTKQAHNKIKMKIYIKKKSCFWLPPSSSDSAIRDDEPRFHLKLRNGLFERDRGRPIFNEPLPGGVVGDMVVERRCCSGPPATFVHVTDWAIWAKAHTEHEQWMIFFDTRRMGANKIKREKQDTKTINKNNE